MDLHLETDRLELRALTLDDLHALVGRVGARRARLPSASAYPARPIGREDVLSPVLPLFPDVV